MDVKKLKKVFIELKQAAALDFAITSPDTLGDCQSCVWCSIAEKYGEKSRGVWVKHWRHGMNKGKPLADLEKIYIAHDLTDEQSAEVLRILAKYYELESATFAHNKSIIISEV